MLDDITDTLKDVTDPNSIAILSHAQDIIVSFANSINLVFLVGGMITLLVIIPMVLFKSRPISETTVAVPVDGQNVPA